MTRQNATERVVAPSLPRAPGVGTGVVVGAGVGAGVVGAGVGAGVVGAGVVGTGVVGAGLGAAFAVFIEQRYVEKQLPQF